MELALLVGDARSKSYGEGRRLAKVGVVRKRLPTLSR
jgi:hypothetical protein